MDASRQSSLVTAFVALGSNLGDPQRQIAAGVCRAGAPARTPGWCARPRCTAARRWVTLDQPDFVNAVAAIETALAPRALLDALLAIERAHGRVRDFPNAPRTLDLDILLYGERMMREPG